MLNQYAGTCFQLFFKNKHLIEHLRLFKVECRNVIRTTNNNKKRFNMKHCDIRRGYAMFVNKTLSRIKQQGYVYLTDPISAEIISNHLCENWKDGYIFEINPGPAVLSKALLKAEVPHLRIFEKNEKFLPAIKDLTKKYRNFEVIEEDFLFLPSLEARTFDDETIYCLEAFFKGIPKLSWEEGAPLRIFSIVSSQNSIRFLRFLLAALSNRSSIFSYGRCELFLVLSHSEYSYLIAEPKENFSVYRWSTVLYRLFFETTILNKFKPDAFFPLPTLRGKKKKEENFYLVKFIPRSDLFSSLVNENKLQDFYFFIRHHFIKRSGLVIPTMEGWVPSCGPRLIKEGMNVFTRFGDLSPEQLLMLFNQFSSWPEYEESIFHVSLRKFYGRSSTPYDDEENA